MRTLLPQPIILVNPLKAMLPFWFYSLVNKPTTATVEDLQPTVSTRVIAASAINASSQAAKTSLAPKLSLSKGSRDFI
jgi:hypothetical protein